MLPGPSSLLFKDGQAITARHRGITLSGERNTSPFRTPMRLSPPMPEVEISAAATLVRIPPIVAPSFSSLGLPFLTTPISVVVPPISITMASRRPVRRMAPMRLAAGPDITVSTGLIRASASPIIDPSPLTIIRGAEIPISPSTAFTERIRSSITGIRRAFIMQVLALSLNPSSEDSSWLQTAGIPRILDMRFLTRTSCSGLRTARYPATAIPSTRPPIDFRKAMTASSSRGTVSLPPRSWEPETRTA